MCSSSEGRCQGEHTLGYRASTLLRVHSQHRNQGCYPSHSANTFAEVMGGVDTGVHGVLLPIVLETHLR